MIIILQCKKADLSGIIFEFSTGSLLSNGIIVDKVCKWSKSSVWGNRIEKVDVTGSAGEDGLICLRWLQCSNLPYHFVLCLLFN